LDLKIDIDIFYVKLKNEAAKKQSGFSWGAMLFF